MFTPLRSVALCCLALALPAPALADLVLKQGAPDKAADCRKAGGCRGTVAETLVLDPNAKAEKDSGTITIRSTDPTVIQPVKNPGTEPDTKAPDPITRAPDPITRAPDPIVRAPDPIVRAPDPIVRAPDPVIRAPDPVITRPVITPDPVRPAPDRTAGTQPPPIGGFVPRESKAPVVDVTDSGDSKPVEEMPYITFAPTAENPDYEISVVDNLRGTGRIRVSTDYGPVFCSGFVFGPTVVATSWACVPGILEDPNVHATRINEIRIVFDHIFSNQRQWTAQGYQLRLDTDLSSEETGLAILHIADPEQSFASDRIQRVGQTQPDPRAPLFMLSHPRGGTMQFHHCNAVAVDPAYLPPKAFEHTCASDLGDLGAPIFDAATGAVVGMHLAHEYATGRRFATHSVDLANWIGDQQ